MASRRARLRRRAGLAFIATGTALATTALTLLPNASASSHREAPLILNNPAVDNTDVYAFTSPDKPDTVTLIGNWSPFSDPEGGPNFYPFAEGAHYDINVDSDGDALPNITYRWVFSTIDLRENTFLYNNGPVTTLDDENLLFRQTYDLIQIDQDGNAEVLLDDQLAAPSNVGPASMPDYRDLVAQASVELPGGGMSYAGQADDSFFLDLRIFDLLYGGDLSEVGNDTLAGYNTNTLAIQVPKSELALNDNPEANPVIGVWSDTEKEGLSLEGAPSGEEQADDILDQLRDSLPEQVRELIPEDAGDMAGLPERQSGDTVQVSRLGNPLVNEVISSVPLKDLFNSSQPVDDADTQPLVDRVLVPEVPILIEQIYGIPAPETPRNDLFEIFLTGIFNDGTEEDEIPVDLNSQRLNADVDPAQFRPSEMTRLNMSIPVTKEPSRLGVLGGDLQGFPNGRRLTDDVVDIEIQALEGAVRTGEIVKPLAAGDKVDANDVPFLDSFPYVGVAQNSAVNGVGGKDGNGAVPPAGFGPGGISWPSTPVVTGVAALALLGTGVFLIRRRPESATIRGGAIPAG